MANTARIATLATPWGDTFGKDLTPTGNELGGPYNSTASADPLRILEIDNTGNTSAISYLRVYNASDASPGTDKPQIIIKAPAGKKVTVTIIAAAGSNGVNLSGGYYATTNQTGGFDGTASPAVSTPIRFVTG